MRAVALAVLCSCGPAARFPLREPMWRDGDLDARSVPCRPDADKPEKRICRPEAYISSFAWDGFDNIITRPLTHFFLVDTVPESANVNSMDEVPDSSWFTNRIGRAPMTVEEMRKGPCGDDVVPVDLPDGSFVVDQGKLDGANPGFRVRLPDGRRYMLKADEPGETERATSASAIASRFYHAAGWSTPCESVIYVRRSIFSIRPGLKVKDNTGITRDFDMAALHRVLDNANRRDDGTVRLSASKWLVGRALGPFRYEDVREDDPNDVIPHEDRRDLRGARVIASWVNHFDAREQNSMDVWLSATDDPDGSPGIMRHYYIDFGDCFGSQWSWDAMSRRLGHAFYLDFGYLLADFFTLGLVVRPWDRAQKAPDGWIFGYFSSRDFDPDVWKPGYPNPAFSRMTERDAAWGARLIARFTDEHIAAAVDNGAITDAGQRAYLVRTLVERRDIILRRYLTELSPIADLRVDGDELCGVDLARRVHVAADSAFHYAAGVRAGPDLALTPSPPDVRVLADGGLCVKLPRAEGYFIVSITNGNAPGRLQAHLYDLGADGFRLVGIER